MKQKAFAILSAVVLCGTFACSNWNRQTPKSMDNSTTEAEIRKNLTSDHITGLSIQVEGGTVTISGHLHQNDHDKAIMDAQKVPGVTNVVDHITIDTM